MDIDIIDGKIYLNGQMALGPEGFEVRTEGVKNPRAGCGSATNAERMRRRKQISEDTKAGNHIAGGRKRK